MAHSWTDSSTTRTLGSKGPVTGMHVLALAAAEAAEPHHHFPLPPWGYALCAAGIFFGLFLVTWSFRSVGQRH